MDSRSHVLKSQKTFRKTSEDAERPLPDSQRLPLRIPSIALYRATVVVDGANSHSLPLPQIRQFIPHRTGHGRCCQQFPTAAQLTLLAITAFLATG
jgi:hypothetical protein